MAVVSHGCDDSLDQIQLRWIVINDGNAHVAWANMASDSLNVFHEYIDGPAVMQPF